MRAVARAEPGRPVKKKAVILVRDDNADSSGGGSEVSWLLDLV